MMNKQGPARPSLSPEDGRTKQQARLSQVVWEASGHMSYDEIREHIEATLREIQADEP